VYILSTDACIFANTKKAQIVGFLPPLVILIDLGANLPITTTFYIDV
jgi:hypothetical protein